MKSKRQNPIPESKKCAVKELTELIKSKKTIFLASIKNIPGSQFQEIVKKLRGKAIVKVPKKNIMFRAIDSSSDKSVQELKGQLTDSIAILFSDMDAFELASDLEESKSPAKAKAGQEAPLDIEIEAGMTELVPGPAISELGAVGLKTKVTQGKLEIIANKVIVKKGGKISQAVADVMSKLDIKPFSVGFITLAAFDTQKRKLYLGIKIDRAGALENLKSAYSKALPFAVEIGYPTEDTIKFLIGKGARHGKALEKFGVEALKEKTPDSNDKSTEQVEQSGGELTIEKDSETKGEANENSDENQDETKREDEVK
ncbi:MAG: 50S ribosomal protein L10 [Nanoarchaeota archaeon]|nr:50S ribosomal protein L10 [Nanoarchaeota archaeon]